MPLAIDERADGRNLGTQAVVALVNHTAPADDLMGSYSCAGIVVAARTVLTARHCVRSRPAEGIDVVVGADNLWQGTAGTGCPDPGGGYHRVRSP